MKEVIPKIDWDAAEIVFEDEEKDIAALFNADMESFVSENGDSGLDRAAVLDKCINLVIEFIDNGVIKTCTSAALSQEGGNYIFSFTCSMPQSAENISLKIKLEVDE